jgi:hypothetical protein
MDELQVKIALIKAQAEIELEQLRATETAKEVAGKSIGKSGLLYITIIVVIGVAASIILDKEKIAAVIGMLSAALMALIQMLNGVAGTAPKQEKPEFEVIRSLIDKLDRLDRKEAPMRVDVEGNKVTVKKGDDVITTGGKNV